MKYISFIFFISILLISVSCKREFADNADFNDNTPVEVYADNTLLFSKIFRFTESSAYLWFDIRNEIANFSSPSFNISYTLNPDATPEQQMLFTKKIDLRGMLYRYDAEKEELTVLNYPLDWATGSDIPADLVFSFARKQKEGCNLLTDATQKLQCERTFILKIDRVEFKGIDFVLSVSEPSDFNSRTLQLNEFSLDLLLTN